MAEIVIKNQFHAAYFGVVLGRKGQPHTHNVQEKKHLSRLLFATFASRFSTGKMRETEAVFLAQEGDEGGGGLIHK